MVWAPANTFLFINLSPIGRISEMGDDLIRVKYLKWLRKTSAAVWFCLTLIPLKSIPRTEYIVLPYNTRASTLWILFDDGILSCPKRGYSNWLPLRVGQNGLRMVSGLNFQIESRAQWVKMWFVGADGIAIHDPVPNSTHLPRHKFRWGRLDWLH